MPVDSLEKLETVFGEWRGGKQSQTERIPVPLLRRAQRAVKVHGIQRVVEATRVYRARLTKGCNNRRPRQIARTKQVVPAFSRIEIAAPAGSGVPFAEAENVRGVKLRIYFSSTETLALLSSFCENGGAR